MPDLGHERVEIGVRVHQEIGDGNRAIVRARHLPARHEQPDRRKRFAGLDLVEKRVRTEEMRAAERPAGFADSNRAGEHLVDKSLPGRKAVRPAGFERQHCLGACDRPVFGRSLGVEMELGRLEDGLQHRQRIERRDLDGDAHQARLPVANRGGPALREKRAQRLRRGIGGRIKRQEGHGRKTYRDIPWRRDAPVAYVSRERGEGAASPANSL